MKLSERSRKRSFTALALACALCAGTFTMVHADALYILTGTGDEAVLLDKAAEAPDFSSQMVYVGSGSNGYELSLKAGRPVRVQYGNTILGTTAQDETVSELLARFDIVPGPLDGVLVDIGESRITLTVGSDLTYYEAKTRTEGYETQRIATPDLLQGQEEVVQAGKNGISTDIYEVVWSNGHEISRQWVEQVESTAVTEIIRYGTSVTSVDASDKLVNVSTAADGSGVLTFASGATMKFSQARTMKCTAYTAGHDGVGTRTATGTTVHRGTVAVDKRYIPLGTRMFIVTEKGSYVYGMAKAEDTGMRGDNKLDLYMDSYNECVSFGRRNCKVYILKPLDGRSAQNGISGGHPKSPRAAVSGTMAGPRRQCRRGPYTPLCCLAPASPGPRHVASRKEWFPPHMSPGTMILVLSASRRKPKEGVPSLGILPFP